MIRYPLLQQLIAITIVIISSECSSVAAFHPGCRSNIARRHNAIYSRLLQRSGSSNDNDRELPLAYDQMPTQYHEFRGANNQTVCLSYRYYTPSTTTDISSPTTIVILLNGLQSSMSGTKSQAIQEYANENYAGYLCFDYRGHGNSSSSFVDCTMHDWMEDSRQIIDVAMNMGSSSNEQYPKLVLVGSSIGACVAVRLALERPQCISGIIGIGSAIDFTYHTFEKMTKEQQQCILSKEDDDNPIVDVYSPYLAEPYPFSRALYESGNDYLLCHNLPDEHSDITLSCSVRFLHGIDDDVVPLETVTNAEKVLQEKYKAKDVTVRLLDGGDHRLSRPDDIKAILKALSELLAI